MANPWRGGVARGWGRSQKHGRELRDFRYVLVRCKHEYVKSGERERVIKEVVSAGSSFLGPRARLGVSYNLGVAQTTGRERGRGGWEDRVKVRDAGRQIHMGEMSKRWSKEVGLRSKTRNGKEE